MVQRQSMRKDGWQTSSSVRQRPFWPRRLQTNTRSQSSGRCSLWTGNASTARFLSHISNTVVIIHLQTHSKEFTLTIHGHLARASSLTPFAIATVSHIHMCWIRGQGSWVVLGGLNGALCIIIHTSSNPRLRKAMPKTAGSSVCSKHLWLEFSFSDEEMMLMIKSHYSTCEPAAYKKPAAFISDLGLITPAIKKGISLHTLKPHSYLAKRGEYGQHIFVSAFLQMCKCVYMHRSVCTHTHMATAIKLDKCTCLQESSIMCLTLCKGRS